MAARRSRLLAALALAGLATSAAALAGAAPTNAAPPERPGPATRALVDSASSGPVRDLPRGRSDKSRGLSERENPPLLVAGPAGPDGALQTSAPSASAAVQSGQGFIGLGLADNAFSVRYAPPDTNGDVSATHYVQAVNTQFAVYDKATGLKAAAPFFGSELFARFGGAGSSCATHDDGDPIVVFDQGAGRWLITQFQVTVTPYLECVAVSDTADPLGSYSLYAYDYGSDFVDYPKISVWGDTYLVTYNVFRNGSFTGGEVCALDRARIVARTAQRPQQCFRTSTSYPSLLAADDDSGDATGPGYVVDLAGGKLNVWRTAIDWATPGSSSFTGPTMTVVASYSPACNGGTCIVQPGTKQKLDSLASRLMNRLASRTVGGVRTFVVSHAVAVPSTSRKPTPSSAVRWYELRPAGDGLSVHQQGTYAPDSTMRWMSSAAIDKAGGIAVGYSASSSSVFPSVRAAGRSALDSPGTLGTEVILKAGAGSQSGQNLSRWGDYASMSTDPDGCTLWFTTEYLTATGAFNWSTWIAPVTLPGCVV